MRILQIVHNLKREGAQMVVANLAQSLDRFRYEPIVFAWRSPGPLRKKLEGAGVEVIGPQGYPGPSVLFGVLGLRRIVQSRRIDLMHAHMSDAAILAYLASKGLGTPFVVTHHSNRLVPTNGLLRRAVLGIAARSAAVNVAVSAAVRDQLIRETGLRDVEAVCIPNGVDGPRQEDLATSIQRRRMRQRGGGGLRIVSVGRLSDVKRHATIIAAMPIILTGCPEARLCIVGDGALRDDLQRLAVETGVSREIAFRGFVDDVGAILAEADVFLSASAYEGLPMSLLEAMSWRLPVVVSDVPGHRGVVRHEENGLLFPADDPPALAAAVLRLAAEESPDWAVATDFAGFSCRSMAAQYEAVYDRALVAPSRIPAR